MNAVMWRHIDSNFRQMMIEEGGSAFHAISHVHAVATPIENLSLKHGFAPSVLRLIQRMSTTHLPRIDF
ncbi:hypothetical protein RZS08_23345, partial [Arthrospira platensis SPKY1]|nr:hypothetical protein [Arthrospira platensis SPKY1]